MSSTPLHAVTGAFGYSGKYIARRLLDSGQRVITLTNSIDRANAFGGQIPAHPFSFDRPDDLVRALDGVDVLYNTYWVRFNHPLFTHADAVRNTLTLFDAAKRAGVRRIVHVSITNPSEDSPLEYFSGKARLERGLRESGLSYAILRPTVLFGKEDILINNIAWALRHLPVFGVFGDGSYRLQPIYVDDLAGLCVAGGAGQENIMVNAIGPETFTYREMTETIARLIGVRRPILPVPPTLGYLAGRAIGALTGDVMITREEIAGLMAGLLCVDTPPTGTTRLTDWITEHAGTLGRRYTSELARRRDRSAGYRSN
jgi:NADH dehydrogenase